MAMDSLIPAFALGVTLGPSVLFVTAYLAGLLRFPSFLAPVHPVEPVIYRALGVGLVKRLVATHFWPRFVGVQLPPRPKGRNEFLDFIDGATKGAEMSHWPTFVLATLVALGCLVGGRAEAATWVFAFNVALNGYPIMLQRSNRWRLQKARGSSLPRGKP